MFPHQHNSGCECFKFYLVQDDYKLSCKAVHQYPNKLIQWDPWPVRQHHSDSLLGHVRALVATRNATSADHCVDAISVLPASPYYDGIQGGSTDRGLYSIRSPSMLPIRVHIWKIPGGKILLRRGLKTQSLSSFLNGLGCFEWKDAAARLEFWKSLPTRDEFMAMVNPPRNLSRKVSAAWYEANPFRLLDLPAELRELILCLALDIRLYSTWQCRLPEKIALCYTVYCKPPSRLKLRSSPITNLVFVNRQIHHEAIAALSANVMVCFKSSNALYHFLEQDFRTTPSLTRPMRSIRLDFDLREELLALFGAPSREPREFEYYNQAGFTLWNLIDADELAFKGVSIDFPSFRPRSGCNLKAGSGLARCYCQHALNEDILIGARPLLSKVRLIEFTGCINAPQKEKWLNMIMEDRKEANLDLEKLSLWQKEAWQVK